MKHSDVVFMYAPGDPTLYDAYKTTAMLWSGGAEAAKEAGKRGIHYQGSIWFLTAWGKNLAEDPQLLGSVCVDIEGKPIEVPWLTDHKQALPNYWGCTNAPYYREYIKKLAVQEMVPGVGGLHIDDHCGTSACASYAGGCFCKHCMEGFRRYLKANCRPDQLAAWDVDNVDNFDYAAYVKRYAKNREEYNARKFSIPLFIPFMNFQARAENELVGEVRAACEKAAGKPLTLSANCGLPNPLHLADYPNLDIFCGEIDVHAARGRPSDVAHLAFKVADGIGLPLAATASGWDWAWIAEKGKPGLVKTWAAESYAFGHRLMAPHHQWCYTAEKGTHWWDGKTEDFAPLYSYVAAHKNLFDGFETVADVALVFNSPAAYRGKGSYQEAVSFLANHNIQYRVTVAGGDWVDKRLSLKDLSFARRVIVVSQDDLDSGQLAVLDSVAKSGRLLQWENEASAADKLIPNVKVQGASNVWAVLRANPQTGETALHLLNRNYNLEKDKIDKTGPLTVTLDADLLRGRAFKQAILHSIPDGAEKSLSLQSRNGKITVEVPGVDLWGVVLMKR